MKKYIPFCLLAVGLFLCLGKSQSQPLDIPYGNTLIVGTTTQVPFVAFSTASLPNSNYRWCISHVVVTSPALADSFSIWTSTWGNLSVGTTNFSVMTSTAVPYDEQWPYRTPYCAPANQPLILSNSVSASTMTWEGYSFGGWNNP